MPMLYMQTDNARSVSQHLVRTAADLRGYTQTLSGSCASLESQWDGPASEQFAQECFDLQRRLETLSAAIEVLGGRVEREVIEWEQTDADGVSRLSNVVSGSFDWGKWGIGMLGKLAAPSFGVPYNSYKSVGRWMNQLIGNSRGGWVGRMDDLGHFLRSPAVQAGIPIGFGILSDRLDGDSWSTAIGSEVIEFGAEKLIYAIPVVGEAYAVYDAALMVGQFAAGGADLLGYHDQAVWLQNTLERFDVGEWIGDTSYYYLTNPDRLLPDVTSTTNRVVDYGAGFVQGATNWVGSVVPG